MPDNTFLCTLTDEINTAFNNVASYFILLYITVAFWNCITKSRIFSMKLENISIFLMIPYCEIETNKKRFEHDKAREI
jgi:hypothetical protein